jgi:hypothetical protein
VPVVPASVTKTSNKTHSKNFPKVRYMNAHFHFNPSKTKRISFIYGLSAYRAVNTLHFGYKNQSLNVL